MKRIAALVPLILVLFLVPAPASAGGIATVAFVNAVAFDAGSDFPLSLCIDGAVEQADVSTGSEVGPMPLAPGDYGIDWVQGTDCTTGSFVAGTITVDPSANVTVMAWWGSDNARGISVLPNDTSCFEPGQSRVTLRHAAATGAVDLAVTPQGGTSTVVITDVAVGAQGSANIAGGTYSNTMINGTGGGPTVLALGSDVLADGSAYFVYLYGGNDGEIGSFAGPFIELQPCAVPPSSSTTTTAAVAAQATSPKFTG